MIPLPSQAYLNEALDYDPITGKLYWKRRPEHHFSSPHRCNNWNSRHAGKEAFTAPTTKGHLVGRINGVNYKAHRIIYKMMTNQDPNILDHDDRDPTNNRMFNLIDGSSKKNQQNMKRFSSNTSGMTGVIWDKARNKWLAYIGANGINNHLGHFDDVADAIACRRQAEQAHGFHANHGR